MFSLPQTRRLKCGESSWPATQALEHAPHETETFFQVGGAPRHSHPKVPIKLSLVSYS
jgi:hypothetical protein